MLLISYGIPKSGSTLAFQLACGVLMGAGYAQRRLPEAIVPPNRRVNFIAPITREVMVALLAEVRADEFIAIKTHSGVLDGVADDLARHGVKVHVTRRDPRENVLSLRDAGAKANLAGSGGFVTIKGFDDACAQYREHLTNCLKWDALPGALPLYYDDLAFDQSLTARVIAKHLGVKLDADFVARHMAGARTQLNKGQPKRWKRDLTPEQQAALTKEFAPMLQQISRERGFVRRALRRLTT